MCNKRKTDDLYDTIAKRSKSSAENSNSNPKTAKLEQDYHYLIDLLSKKDDSEFETKEESNGILNILSYFKRIFPTELFENLPQIIHLHQIYSLFRNKTKVDREIEALRADNRIILFKFDSNLESETLICFRDDFKEYILTQIQQNSKHKYLIDIFLNKILPNETSQLSISKTSLLTDYKIGDSDISSLIQLGLLAIKDPSNFWFSIPNLGKFRRILLATRKSLLDLLRRQKYKEINLRSFFNNLLIQKHKNFKTINKIGAIYVVCDLIGNDLIRKIDSPMGIVIKLV